MFVRLFLEAIKIELICSKFIFLCHGINWSVSKFICICHQSANWSVVSSSAHTLRRLNQSVCRFNLHCICICELICSKFTCIPFTCIYELICSKFIYTSVIYFNELICSKFICICICIYYLFWIWTDLFVSSFLPISKKILISSVVSSFINILCKLNWSVCRLNLHYTPKIELIC
jgi:hypothetical protein